MGNFICGNQEQLNPGAQGKIPGILQRGPFANMRNKNQQHDGSLRPPHVMHGQRHRHGGRRPLKLQQFANQMRVGAKQTRPRSYSWDKSSHQQFSIRSFGKVCREYQEKGVTKQQQNAHENNMLFKENEDEVTQTFKNRRLKSQGETFKKQNRKKGVSNCKSYNKLDSLSTQEKLPSLKPKKESSFFIARKLRSLGGFNNNDDNEMFFDCLGSSGQDDKSAGHLTQNNKQNSNGELTFMPRTASKKEQDGGLTFSDSEVEVEEEEESYYGGGRILCIRRGFGWPGRRKPVLSEEHKDEVIDVARKEANLSGDNNHKPDKSNRIKYCGSDDLDGAIEEDTISADSDEYIFTRKRAHSECFECTGQCKPKLLDELEEQERDEESLAIHIDINSIIKEETLNKEETKQNNTDNSSPDADIQPVDHFNPFAIQKEDEQLDNKDEQKEQMEQPQQQEQELTEKQPEEEQQYEKADLEELVDHY